MEIGLAIIIIAVAAVLIVVLTVRSLIIVCPPNQVAVISGRARMEDGRRFGYRVLQGGRTIRIPIIEKVSWLTLNTLPIEVAVQNAYSKGAIPLNVQGIANVKISSDPVLLENSVERFLERPTQFVSQLAKETLEANLRGVLATLTPEEVNEDRLKFAETLITEAHEDLTSLGLNLDTLKIQNVTDEVGYLDSVGRKQTALVLREARVAEAQRSTEAAEEEAIARRKTELARVEADLAIVERENALRERRAELEATAIAKEEEAKVAGEKARVVAEQSLEQERIELENRRLEADIVAPARARKQALELDAKGEAAKIIEDGEAQVEVFRRLTTQFQTAGDDAHKIYVLNVLPQLIDSIVGTLDKVDIDRVSIIDTGGEGSGGGIPTFLSQLPGAVIKITEQIENATGVDLLAALTGRRTGGNGSAAPAGNGPEEITVED